MCWQCSPWRHGECVITTRLICTITLNLSLSLLLRSLSLSLLKHLSFAEHRGPDTGGGGFTAQLHRTGGDDIGEPGLRNPVCQTHLHSNPGGGRRPVALFAAHTRTPLIFSSPQTREQRPLLTQHGWSILLESGRSVLWRRRCISQVRGQNRVKTKQAQLQTPGPKKKRKEIKRGAGKTSPSTVSPCALCTRAFCFSAAAGPD